MEEEPSQTATKIVRKKYILRMHSSVMERILKHISSLKLKKSSYQSTRGWIIQAIEDKLQRDESLSTPKVPKSSHVLLSIDGDTIERLDAQVNLIKKLKGSYSIKSWIIDAIEEKLGHDTRLVSQLAQKIREES
jgi:hypothetical protein